MKTITYTATVLKQMKALDKPVAKKIVAKIQQYAADPKSLANQVKHLQGSELLRLRVGDYRVIFSEDGQVVALIQIGHRKDIYR